jgi:hypothetical protein
MNRGAIFLVLAALAFAPVQAAAQSEWEQQVIDQINGAAQFLSSEGYTLVGTAQTGSLNDGAAADFEVTLQAGVHYFLIGVCDNDCPDIDLSLFDGSGNQVDSDYEDDAFPMVEVTPSGSGGFGVHVYMASCDAEPCYYGVGVYAESSLSGASGAPANQSYQDRLDAGDDRISGTYYDTYVLHGNPGDEVVLELHSSDFDTYLGLVAPSGELTENDDYEGSTSRSRIETQLNEAGEWTVVVTSYQSGATGAYELNISTRSAGKSAPLSKGS